MQIQWQKCLGGTSEDMAKSIQQTTDGGYIVAGYTGSNDGDISGNHGGLDIWVVKLYPEGNIQWQKCLGGTNTQIAHSIKQTTDGGYIVLGETTLNNLTIDIWLIKIDQQGNIQGQKGLGGTEND